MAKKVKKKAAKKKAKAAKKKAKTNKKAVKKAVDAEKTTAGVVDKPKDAEEQIQVIVKHGKKQGFLTYDEINDLFNKLGSYSPLPQERGDIIRSVMEATSNDENKKGFNLIMYYLFGWTDYLWVRRGLVTVSIALVFSFVFQQFSIVNRVGQLEDRMVESNTE